MITHSSKAKPMAISLNKTAYVQSSIVNTLDRVYARVASPLALSEGSTRAYLTSSKLCFASLCGA